MVYCCTYELVHHTSKYHILPTEHNTAHGGEARDRSEGEVYVLVY